jgi:toxin FitB
MILVDTNVVSELWRPQPEALVVHWFDRTPDESLHLSAVSLGELHFGIMRLPEGRRKEAFAESLRRLQTEKFVGRFVAFGQNCSTAYGVVRTLRERAGRPIDAADAAIAATALTFGMSLATRNVRDFDGLGLDLINPFGDA